jgi:hypothetical protein
MSLCCTVTTFADLTRYIAAFMKPDGLRLLFVVGDPGGSKSWTIKRMQKKAQHVYIKAGRLTAFQLYKLLYKCRNRAIILDDVEDALKREDTRKLLMQACETDDEARKVGWLGTESRLVVQEGKKTVNIPQEFECTSRICLVCNNWGILTGKFGPLLDRGIVVFFDPPRDEIHRYVGDWFKDKEKTIYEFIGSRLDAIGLHSIRYYVHAAEMKRHGLDWEAALIESWTNEKKVPPPTEIFKQIMADATLKTNEERIAAFEKRTGLRKRTFYNYKRNFGSGRKAAN